MRGVIVKLKPSFGFIEATEPTEAAGVEYFFVPSGLQRTTVRFDDLGVGEAVEFTPIAGARGPRAIEIRVLEG